MFCQAMQKRKLDLKKNNQNLTQKHRREILGMVNYDVCLQYGAYEFPNETNYINSIALFPKCTIDQNITSLNNVSCAEL